MAVFLADCVSTIIIKYKFILDYVFTTSRDIPDSLALLELSL